MAVLAHHSSSAPSLPQGDTAPPFLGWKWDWTCPSRHIPSSGEDWDAAAPFVVMICVQEGRPQPKPALVASEINPWTTWMVSECLPGAGFGFWTLPVGWTSSFRGQSRTGLLPARGVHGDRSLPCQCGWGQGHPTAEPKAA